MKPNDIICPMCGVVCGKFYPATDVDPGFREGIGEEFMDEFLNFHCSQSCLDAAVEYAIENRTCICHEGPDSVGTVRSCPVHGIPETDPLGLPRAYVVETMSSVPPEAQREIDKIVQASHDSGPHVVHDIFAGFNGCRVMSASIYVCERHSSDCVVTYTTRECPLCDAEHVRETLEKKVKELEAEVDDRNS